jgi:transposase
MQQPKYFIGADISSDTFTVSVGISPWKQVGTTRSFENTTDGFEEFLIWLDKQGITNKNSVVCMESTGVYGQGLAYFLFSHNYTVSVEPPLKVKKAFPTHGNKNDITDSKHIAEYACRHYDELHIWRPPHRVLEQVQTLLKTREQLTKIGELKTVIKKIDKEIKDLFEKHPFFNHRFANLLSIPCVGVQLAGYVLVSLYKKDKDPKARSLAGYVGICPYEHESGTSVRKKPRSRKNGVGKY